MGLTVKHIKNVCWYGFIQLGIAFFVTTLLCLLVHKAIQHKNAHHMLHVVRIHEQFVPATQVHRFARVVLFTDFKIPGRQ